MAAKAIPDRLRGEIAGKLGEGLTTRAVVKWLESEHGVKVGHATVVRYVQKIREERRGIAQAVVREGLAASLTSDLDLLRSMLRQCDERMKDADDGDFARLVSAAKGLLDLKTKLSGAQEPSESVANFTVYLPQEDPEK